MGKTPLARENPLLSNGKGACLTGNVDKVPKSHTLTMINHEINKAIITCTSLNTKQSACQPGAGVFAVQEEVLALCPCVIIEVLVAHLFEVRNWDSFTNTAPGGTKNV